MLRLILYVLAGMASVLLGWNLYQICLFVLEILSNNPSLAFLNLLRQWPEMILFPLITIFLASGMVLNEIFISNPTRPTLNLKVAIRPLIYTVIIGLLVGLMIGSLLQIFYLPQFDIGEKTIRVVSWWSIGATVGLIEGITWQFHSMEAGDQKRYRKRLLISLFAASLSSIIAAGIFEWIRDSFNTNLLIFQQIEDPLGFCILGMLLGIAFTITTSPSYMAALRAGKGFEYRVDDISRVTQSIDTTYIQMHNNSKPSPVISKAAKTLKFVSEESAEKIEEGLSIQLPETGEITIGGRMIKDKKRQKDGTEVMVGSDIYLPSIPPHLAHLYVSKREAKLKPSSKYYNQIEINFSRLDSPNEVILKHNTLIAFYADEPDENNPNQPKMYRFVYYNRFLDPQG